MYPGRGLVHRLPQLLVLLHLARDFLPVLFQHRPGGPDVVLGQREPVRHQIVVGERVGVGGPIQRLVLAQVKLPPQGDVAKLPRLVRLTDLLVDLLRTKYENSHFNFDFF